MGTECRYLGPWYQRPLIALVLLMVEYLAVSFFFDAYQLVEVGGVFGGLSVVKTKALSARHATRHND